MACFDTRIIHLKNLSLTCILVDNSILHVIINYDSDCKTGLSDRTTRIAAQSHDKHKKEALHYAHDFPLVR